MENGIKHVAPFKTSILAWHGKVSLQVAAIGERMEEEEERLAERARELRRFLSFFYSKAGKVFSLFLLKSWEGVFPFTAQELRRFFAFICSRAKKVFPFSLLVSEKMFSFF